MTLAELERGQSARTLDIDVICNPWAEPLYRFPSPYDYRIVFRRARVVKDPRIHQRIDRLGALDAATVSALPAKHLKSLDESAKPELEERIREMGLMRADCYRVTNTSIDHANGTHIFFIGLSKVSEEDIKGLAFVDILWIEEGQSDIARIVGTGRPDHPQG